MASNIRIAVAGVGLAGRQHVESILATQTVTLACIVDPSTVTRTYASEIGVPWYASLNEMFCTLKVDGAILATPNQVHVKNALECIANKCPILIEKPIAVNVMEAEKLIMAASAANVPILTGHHRRHNPLIKKAKSLIDSGELGSIVSVQGSCWFYKPDNYFDIQWRREKGAGPVFINLIHDIDLLLHLCGDIRSLQALESSEIRGNDIEESAVVMLRFVNSALGTISVSDTIVAPWSWELTAKENPVYPATTEACYMIGGTHASLSLPNLKLWRHEGSRNWWNPLSATTIAYDFDNPLNEQVRHFAAVIRQDETPLVSGEDGLKALRVVEDIKLAANSGKTIFTKGHDH